MATFKDLLESLSDLNEAADDKLGDFYNRSSQQLGLSKAKPHRHSQTGAAVPNHSEFTTSTDHDKIFKHLRSIGFKKTGGYDSAPDKWTSRTDHESMTWSTDPVHDSKNKVSVRLAKEHGGPTKVIFNTWPK